MQQALTVKSETEYELAAEYQSVWIAIHNLSVYVKRNDDNVSVSIYPLEHEDAEAIAETYAAYTEGIVEDEEEADA